MNKSKDDLAYVWDMMEAAKFVVQFLQGSSFHQFQQDELLRSGVERKMEIIGEAARHVSKDFQTKHPEVAWKKITGLRHILAHEYGEIKQEILWTIAERDVPELINLLQPILDSKAT